MVFLAGRIRPIALIAAALLLGAFGYAQGHEQQARDQNHDLLVVAQAQTPSNTCARERTACLQAHVREGSFGSRYVPPDEGAECEAAYQACLNPDACTRGRAACLKGAVRRTTAGVAYVPPDDLARCNETYRACAPGGAAATPKSSQPAARPPVVDINGAWGSNIGVNYQITQTGNSFRWVCGIRGETGNGTIEGNKVSASWSGPSGSGSASGVVVVVGRPTRIEWSNGVIFLRR
jgi:hypothetical protein